MTHFGPKRRLLDEEYPLLCPFFDNMNNDTDLYNDAAMFYYSTKMTPAQTELFKTELMRYSMNNLVKITAYIESPYVSEYQTDEV